MVDLENVPGSPASAALIDRAKGIILKPNEEWPKIAAEQTTQGEILRGYVLPLAAIGPVAGLIGGQIFGYGGFGFSFRPGLVGAISTAILGYVLTIVGVFVLAFIANWLAPKFDGREDKTAAFKLVAFSATAGWLAGVFSLIPMLAVFGLLGLYSLYLFYTGTGPMMAIPEAKRVGYTAVTVVAAAVLYWLVAIVAGSIVAAVGLGSGIAPHIAKDDHATISIPGVGTVDTGKMEEAAERMEKMQSGELKTVSTDTLKSLLPEKIGAFERTGFSSSKFGNAGAGVEGKYAAGDQRFELRVNDMLALSGIAGMGAMMGIEQEREDDDGYERIGTVDGQWRTEKWNSRSNSGSYGILVGERFQVEASGNVENIGVLKAAVSAIDEGDLENLAE